MRCPRRGEPPGMVAGASVVGETAVPSDSQLLEEMDPQALWKDVQRHAGHGALPLP